MFPGAPDSPDRSCQEHVSTARRHKQFADAAKGSTQVLTTSNNRSSTIFTTSIVLESSSYSK